MEDNDYGADAFMHIENNVCGYFEVKTSVLNVREGPGTNYEKNGKLLMSQMWVIYDVNQDDSDYTWYKIADNKWIADKDEEYITYYPLRK